MPSVEGPDEGLADGLTDGVADGPAGGSAEGVGLALKAAETQGPPAVPLVVLAWGNPSRGDDALGPLLLARLQAGLGDAARVRWVEDFQLQIEHALDLQGAALALFIDAGAGTPAPWQFQPLAEPAPGTAMFSASSHALAPEAVLAVYRQLHGRAPPPAFVLCVRGESFALGAPLGAAAAARLAAAADFARGLCAQPDAAAWQARTGVPAVDPGAAAAAAAGAADAAAALDPVEPAAAV